jgi:hypothetical protein
MIHDFNLPYFCGTTTVLPSLALKCASWIISMTAVASSHFTASSEPFLIALARSLKRVIWDPGSVEGHLQ